jgi:PAS domain S-box-containing protein
LRANNDMPNHDDSQSIALLALIPNAALAYDGNLDVFYFNELAAQWFGVEHGKAPIKCSDLLIQVTKPDEQFPLPNEKTPWQRAWNGEKVQGLQVVLAVAQQAPRFVLCNCSVVTNTEKSTSIAIVSMVDISSINAEYKPLLDDRAQMGTILEGMNAGIWQWNLQTGATNINERWAQIAGYSLEELDPVTLATWSKFTHPDDVEVSRRLLKQHVDGETSHYSTVFRMKHKDGHWVWVQSRGRVYQWDAQGKPLWMAGTNLDVSYVRTAEEDARSSQAYMQAIIDSSSEVAIIATTTEGLLAVFNTGAERLLGYSEEEVVGKLTPASFHVEEEVIARGQELTATEGYEIAGFEVFVHAARQGRSETRKWTYVCKSGEYRRVSLSVSALRDERNSVIGFLGIAIDETAQLAAEEQALLAAQRFAGAFGSTAVGMALVSLEGRWMEVNDALCEMLGYSRDELLITDFQTLTHPEDLQNDLDLLARLLANDIPNYEMNKRYYRKNGELIQAKLWVALVRNGRGEPQHFVSQIQDITDEYLAEQALQASEARLRGLFDLSPVGISLMDYKSGKQLEANDALVAPTGYSRKEFMALTDWELTPREYAPLMNNAIEELRTIGRFTPFEKEYIRKDGTRYPILAQGILMKDPSGRQVLWTLAEDISERKRLDQVKNEFVSTVSHELRTPLTSISGALSLIVSGVLGEVNDEVRDMLKIAAKSSGRLSALVNDLLDMDKLLAGKMELQIEKVDLLPLLDDTISGMAAFAHEYGVEIVRSDDTAMQIQTDDTRLVQVLTNLLSNACKHSAHGGRVELHHVAGPEDSVILSVIDHGEGIPKKFRSHIFQKFAQADGSDSSTKKGTGLGLAICKELVERMGGVIGYESHEGQGSQFWIRLPRARIKLSRESQKPTVLHVEDDVGFAKLVSMQMGDWVNMDLATDLALANKKIRENHYDLILLDLSLPDGSGEELWESLHLSQADVPIIILSGHEVPRRLANNVAAVLVKDGTTVPRIISTLQHIFEMGDA